MTHMSVILDLLQKVTDHQTIQCRVTTLQTM